MRSFARLINTLVLALVVLGALPDAAEAAKPKPGVRKSRGFSLLAGVRGLMAINRVQCGVNSAKGEVCVDITGSTVLGGGFWPRGTVDQYVFNSGLQVGGIIDPASGFEWAGDTTGAFFFDPKGTTENGEGVEPVYNTADPEDFAFISNPAATDPVALAARVPVGDVNELLFNPLLRGRTAASQGDFWFLAWEGNPGLNAGRSHPLGLLVETRGMGWNFPSGNEDIIYLIYTFYNVTSLDPTAYAAVRPGMRDILLRQAQQFHQRNEASFGVDIPAAGYTINQLFAAFATDPDVAEATTNFATVNVPFAMGFVYEQTFSPDEGWTFDPAIFGPPFFAGSGFFGVKYLKSPEISPGVQAGLSLYGNTINGGAFNDAQNAIQLYRYLSNNISAAAGDEPCNTGNPQITHICYVNTTAADDMRFFQSSGPLTLAPGQFGSIVVAYVFAAPVAAAGCTGPGTCGSVNPGDATRLSNLATAGTPNPIDQVAGYQSFADDGDGIVEQTDFIVVPRSLYGKALVAQAVFDKGFLLPFAPESPNFFLVPGSNQVSVIWQPSGSEATGDPFFSIASSPTNPDGTPNVLFDPNYRQLDVEGYRVYRGRVDNPNQLTLLAQFDYTGTFISDYRAQINPVETCAPEIGIDAGPIDTDGDGIPDTDLCDFDPITPGVAPTKKVDIPLVTDPVLGPVTQVVLGNRVALATGVALILASDTASIGAASGCLEAGDIAQCALRDNGVPFIFTDNTPRNNLRYFYSVTAFDVNSFQSGPSSIESARNTKSTTPVALAANVNSTAVLTQFIDGRGVNVSQDTSLPRIDASGRFSKKFPAANNVAIEFIGQFAQLIFSGQGSISATLTGLGLGDARNGIPITYNYQVTSADGVVSNLTLAIAQELDLDNITTGSPPFPGATADPALSARFDVPAGFVQSAQLTQGIVGYQAHTAFGRGCTADGLLGASCTYNGPRWFQGANETKADPNAGNVAGSGDATNNNNAGELPGVLTIQNPQSYNQNGIGYRIIESVLAGGVRAADFNVHWGAAGLIDSVVDLTHNVPVPFMADSMSGGWGILNQANSSAAASGDASTGVVSLADFGCVLPFANPAFPAAAAFGCPAGVSYLLSNTAVPGPVAIYGGGPVVPGALARPNPGFGMYLAGHIFMFELAPGSGVPTAGTVWTMRSYIGFVNGGNGVAGNIGAYSFTGLPRSFSALGATVRLSFDATNAVVAATKDDLTEVHTVPDPYYVTNAFEQSTDVKIIKFVNLPNDAIIRIYSSSGVLVSLLEHHSTQFGGSEDWNVRNRNNQVVASGVYFYHLESGGARRVGRFTIVNFAQ